VTHSAALFNSKLRDLPAKKSKHQHPSSREIPNTKLQFAAHSLIWNLKFEVSLELGAWNLELLLATFPAHEKK
jgi:hypothetical protein